MQKKNCSIRPKIVTCLLAACMVFVCLLAVACGSGGADTTGGSDSAPSASISGLKAFEALESLDAADIQKVEVFTASEDGMGAATIEDSAEIEEIYRLLRDVQIGDKTNMDTLDDDLSLKLETSTEVLQFDFAGDILYTGGATRYEVEGLDGLKAYLYDFIEY